MKPFRIVTGLFAACMLSLGLLGAGPAVEQARAIDNAVNPIVVSDTEAGLQTQAVTRYPIWIGNKQVTSKNAKNVLGNGTVSYNAGTNTLTLKNAKLKGAYTVKSSSGTYLMGIRVWQSKGLHIVLKGKNTISIPKKAGIGSYGIYASTMEGSAGNVLISGSGSLKVKAGKAGLFTYGIMCQNLNIEGNAKVTACGGTTVKTKLKAADKSQAGSFGIWNTGVLGLFGSAKLTAIGKKHALYKAPTFASNYTPQVKAGASAKSIKVSKKKPASSVYTKYKYVSISNAKKSSTGNKPATIKITKAGASGNSIVVEWDALTKNCTGYKLQLSKNSSFSGDNTWTYSTSNPDMDSATLSSLSSNTLYYVHLRGVNKVGSKTYYGAWSATKSVRTA